MADAGKILRLLLKKYPDPGIALDFSNPLELLVATILSAQCTDKRVNEVTRQLFRKYKSAHDYAVADIEVFEQEIKPTGFYKNKARQVINCCKALVEKHNGKVPDSLEALTELPGVGRKTANVVLGSAFGKQAIAVDTHVLRVSNRLGLVHSDNPEKVEEELMKQIPKDEWTRFTLAMILHGRETCKAKRPECSKCILFDECEWQEKGNYV
ncbi:MAG TPA: endonuclease III [Nitrospirae bacterium]|nr:endonuclease III [Nitrospirota bacterium]